MHRPILLCVPLVAALACGGAIESDTQDAPLGATDQAASGTPLKPVIAGLLDRKGEPPSGYIPAVDAYVVEASWQGLQSANGGPLTQNNVIDQAVLAVRALNQHTPGLHVSLRVRILAGIDAPGWAKSLGGAPVSVTDSASGASGTIGRFWTPAFRTAYDGFLAKLAAAYDSTPEIRDVTIARCTTVYDEPFIRQISDAPTVHNLLAAGYTDALNRACLQEQVDAARVWKTTRQSLAFNPYQQINADGTTGQDEAFTESMMDYCRATLGAQCVLQNNSIRYPEIGGGYASMYAHMKVLGPPMSFQTATLGRIGSLDGTLQWAVGEGANSVELPSGYTQETAAHLQTFANALAGNPK